MHNLNDLRANEAQCRMRAEVDEAHRELWLSMAERWASLAHRTAAFYFQERSMPSHLAYER